MNLLKEITLQIKEEASRLGFAACGMAPAGEIDGENCRFMQQWLERKDYGDRLRCLLQWSKAFRKGMPSFSC